MKIPVFYWARRMADFDDDGSLDEIDNEGSVGVESSEDERYSAEYFGLETDEVENFDEDEEEEEEEDDDEEEDDENFTATEVAELAFTGKQYIHLESEQLPDSLFDNEGREKILWWSRSEELEVSGYVDIDANALVAFLNVARAPLSLSLLLGIPEINGYLYSRSR